MITTIDGYQMKRGDNVWEIGIDKDGYRPTRSKVHGGGISAVCNPNKTWKSYDNCLKACELMNRLRLIKA